MSLDLDPALPPLRVADAAAALAVSDDSVYRGVQSGAIRALKLGSAIRIPRSEIRRLLLIEEDETPAAAAGEARKLQAVPT